MNRTALARQIIDTCLAMTKLGLNQGTAVQPVHYVSVQSSESIDVEMVPKVY